MMCRRVERLGASLLLANLSPTALHCQSLFTHCHKTEFSVVHFPRSALDTLVFKSTVYQTLYCTLYKCIVHCILIPISTAASFPHTLQFYLHHISIVQGAGLVDFRGANLRTAPLFANFQDKNAVHDAFQIKTTLNHNKSLIRDKIAETGLLAFIHRIPVYTFIYFIYFQPACVHSVQCAAPSRVENC